jgi:transcription initiation factor TFIIH subunit 4
MAEEQPKEKKRKKVSTNGVLDYLRTALPRETLLDLYADEARGRFVCRAILQQLSDVGQQIVMRLSCCGGSFPIGSQPKVPGVRDWVHQKQKLPQLLKELKKWGIIQSDKAEDIALTGQFHKGLQASIQSLDSSPWQPLSQSSIAALAKQAPSGTKYKQISTIDLETHTQETWDAVLHYMVGTPNVREPSPAVKNFLEATGLMQPAPGWKGAANQAPLNITSRGFQFMLLDTHQQVWHFVVQYLQSIEGHKKSDQLLTEAMLFLISLSFAKVGDGYSSSGLSKRGQRLVQDLSLFGLLYVQNFGEKNSVFYPTQIALQLVQESSSTDTSMLWSLSTKALDEALAHPRPHDSSHLAIIVQTNFQLCAYTTSHLHVAMLSLFCDEYTIRRLPNVVFMIITRDSVKKAFASGIKAEQILRFLEKHAHPKLRSSSGSPIPQNVEDQIWLWDREQRRLQWTEVFQIDCQMAGEFESVKGHTEQIEAYVWSSKAKGIIYADFSSAEQVQAFSRKWRAKRAAEGP